MQKERGRKMKMTRHLKFVVAGLALVGLMAGCGKSSSSSSDSKNQASTEKQSITAVGSTALQPLVESAAEAFSNENSNYQIDVQGGGSGTGLSQVQTGAVDIGNSDVFAEEKSGIDSSKLVDHKVAVVGMAPVVNKEVGVTNITKEDLIKVFTGKVTNWKEIGGKDQTIVVVNRATGSGTRATFEKWGLDGATPIKSQEQDSSGTVKKIVSQTPGAISYLAFSQTDDTLKMLSVDGVKPTNQNVATNKWVIWSYEHMYTKGKPTTKVKKFLDYVLSKEVQGGLVEKMGYLPVTDMKVERDSNGKVK